MAEAVDGGDGDRLRRLRWRLRGAALWPAFVLFTLAEVLLLRWLPLAGDGGTAAIPALLLAGGTNVAAIALVGGLGGAWLRRRRSDLPRVVADNNAGIAALVLVAASFVAIGLVHRPQIAAQREAFAAQSLAARRWVEANGDDFARAHVDRADSILVDRDLYRTCVPGPDPRRWLCLIVDTSRSPARVRRDANRESNASLNPRGGFR